MKPGRELDLLVAEKVMGLTKTGYLVFDKDSHIVSDICDFPKPYSEDISAAWEVVKKMREKEYRIQIRDLKYGFLVVFEHKVKSQCDISITAPHAICVAALKAKGVEVCH